MYIFIRGIVIFETCFTFYASLFLSFSFCSIGPYPYELRWTKKNHRKMLVEKTYLFVSFTQLICSQSEYTRSLWSAQAIKRSYEYAQEKYGRICVFCTYLHPLKSLWCAHQSCRYPTYNGTRQLLNTFRTTTYTPINIHVCNTQYTFIECLSHTCKYTLTIHSQQMYMCWMCREWSGSDKNHQ